jgi:hypothetical protein
MPWLVREGYFFGCEVNCSIGRGPQFVRFRRFLFDKLFGPKASCEIAEKGPIGNITFSVPIGSSRGMLVSMFVCRRDQTR